MRFSTEQMGRKVASINYTKEQLLHRVEEFQA